MDRSEQSHKAIEMLGRALDAKIESTAAEPRGEIKRLGGEMKTEFKVVNARLDEQR